MTTGAFSWLNDLIRWLGRLIPRLTMVPPTHRGILFGPRGGAEERGPGLVFWWPIAYQLVRLPVTTQSIDISPRAMPLPENGGPLPRIVVCGSAAQYRIVDALKAATKAISIHALVENRIAAAIGAHWQGIDSAHEAVEAAREESIPWLRDTYGVLLERLDVTHLGVCVGLLNIDRVGTFYDDASGAPRAEAGEEGKAR